MISFGHPLNFRKTLNQVCCELIEVALVSNQYQVTSSQLITCTLYMR